ncbi:hypothetical protein Aca07nite_20180 [Actinoplanes capillaceus]|uniref:Uncharacterized protein n=1 Tax=Actinoplanes campanulatus TaxID=113559 RepID=A0ABQ3WG16_9ACTN|nr:hypothetical protein Aca07nite_20180 [Actinoplanes capillaceus]
MTVVAAHAATCVCGHHRFGRSTVCAHPGWDGGRACRAVDDDCRERRNGWERPPGAWPAGPPISARRGGTGWTGQTLAWTHGNGLKDGGGDTRTGKEINGPEGTTRAGPTARRAVG